MSIEREIQEWRQFGRALRQENRELFERMLKELDPDILQSAMVLAKEPFDVILMALIFKQQRMISRLIEEIRRKH